MVGWHRNSISLLVVVHIQLLQRMGVVKFKTEYEQANGWTRWVIPTPNYLMACCDCGLVHRMQFKVHKGDVVFRAQRAPKKTAQLRKAAHGKKD